MVRNIKGKIIFLDLLNPLMGMSILRMDFLATAEGYGSNSTGCVNANSIEVQDFC